jgi:hypothetical protein
VAAHLARGMAVSELGPAVRDPVTFERQGVRRLSRSEWEAAVVDVDGSGT